MVSLKNIRALLRPHRKSVTTLRRARSRSFNDICEFLANTSVRMTAPLVLISQVSRSGGTLLSQLFDGHPQVAAHPHELGIGYPSGEYWLAGGKTPRETLAKMAEHDHFRLARSGYFKGHHQTDRLAFLLSAAAQDAIFTALWQAAPPRNSRDFADIYFSSYFQAWLNYRQPLAGIRYVTAFQPRFATSVDKVEAFFSAYPDGFLIQILRDPWSWYASARNDGRWLKRKSAPERILREWVASAEAMIRNSAAYEGRAIIVRFDELLGATEPMMRKLCDILSLDFQPSLLRPTFNGDLMTANSSYAVPGAGIIDAPALRKKQLAEEEMAMVSGLCADLYRAASSDPRCISFDKDGH